MKRIQHKLSREKVSYIRKTVVDFFRREGRRFPWRETCDPYVVLVSELLLQKTTSRQVLEVFDEFFRTFPSIESLAEADIETLKSIVRRLGLIKRATFLKEIAVKVVKAYGGIIPDDHRLLKLKGVGMYTANAVLCFAYGKKVPVVDSNVARIFRRYFGIKGEKPAYADKALWQIARSILPDDEHREFNYGLLDISAKYCRPRPLCEKCPLRDKCWYAKQGEKR